MNRMTERLGMLFAQALVFGFAFCMTWLLHDMGRLYGPILEDAHFRDPSLVLLAWMHFHPWRVLSAVLLGQLAWMAVLLRGRKAGAAQRSEVMWLWALGAAALEALFFVTLFLVTFFHVTEMVGIVE